MARRRQDADEDEITEAAEADDTAGAATSGSFSFQSPKSFRGPMHVTPPSMPAEGTIRVNPGMSSAPRSAGVGLKIAHDVDRRCEPLRCWVT